MTDTQAGLLPCPFCGGTDVDAQGWLAGDGRRGPECMGCGATADSVERWNTRPSPPASAEVGVLSCKASELQEYGCACRWEGMKLADICDAHKEALKASGAAVQVPEDLRGVLAETYNAVESVRAALDATSRNAEEAGKKELGAMLYRYARNLVVATKHAQQVLAAAPQKQGGVNGYRRQDRRSIGRQENDVLRPCRRHLS